MAGPLTNTAIGVIIFGIILSTGIYMLMQFSNGYNVPIESNFTSFTGYVNQTYASTSQYNNVSDTASINSQSLGTAQLQGLISAEQTKSGYFKTLTASINDFFVYFPILSYISVALISIIGILFFAMFYRAVRGVDP